MSKSFNLLLALTVLPKTVFSLYNNYDFGPERQRTWVSWFFYSTEPSGIFSLRLSHYFLNFSPALSSNLCRWSAIYIWLLNSLSFFTDLAALLIDLAFLDCLLFSRTLADYHNLFTYQIFFSIAPHEAQFWWINFAISLTFAYKREWSYYKM